MHAGFWWGSLKEKTLLEWEDNIEMDDGIM
jgi:hypothetical protein